MNGPRPLAAAVCDWVAAQAPAAGRPALLMLSGAQGIGKSHAMRALAGLAGLRVCTLGLDDFYLGRAERLALGRQVHPLCATRGPPGTHDLPLLHGVLDRLAGAAATTATPIPLFDKRSDDRLPVSAWRQYAGRPDIILIEGWLMGALADPAAASAPPLNRLEAQEDSAGIWRGWQEAALAGDYQPLWDRADAFLHLIAPDFGTIAAWRTEQEAETQGVALPALSAERRAWVNRFIQHYERITTRMMAGARRPGTAIRVDRQRQPVNPPPPAGG